MFAVLKAKLEEKTVHLDECKSQFKELKDQMNFKEIALGESKRNIEHIKISHNDEIKVPRNKLSIFEPWHEISNNVVFATSKASDQSAHTHSLIRAFASRLNIKWVLSYGLNVVKRRLQWLVWVYTCQNTTLLEITSRLIYHNIFKTSHKGLN